MDFALTARFSGEESPKTLLPDPIGTLEATRELVGQGFDVLVYTSDDPRLAVRLAELGVKHIDLPLTPARVWAAITATK